MALSVVGGVYYEQCARPAWDHLYGSAGRAAVGLAKTGAQVDPHSYFTPASSQQFRGDFAWHANSRVHETPVGRNVRFRYLYDTSRPEIYGREDAQAAEIRVKAGHVVRFGMLEGEGVVDADWAVYDPQNMGVATPFTANGSKRLIVADDATGIVGPTQAVMCEQGPLRGRLFVSTDGGQFGGARRAKDARPGVFELLKPDNV